MSDSVRPHRRQPARLPHPWDSPGKNTGVGCHFLFKCMKVKSESEVAQSCPTVSNPMDCSLPGSSVHGIFQARVLEWGATAFSGCWYRQAQLHHKWYVYSSPDHFLTFCPRSQCNVFFFFFKPECLSQGTAISSKSCFGSEGLRTQPLAHPPLP